MNSDQGGDWVTRLFPAGTQASFGAMSGAAAGYALRQGGKVVGVLLGGGFMFVQSLAYMGYLEVDWRKVERDYNKILDRDADGKVTAKDFQLMLDNTTEVLKFNLPAGSGFAAGFAYGISGSMKAALGTAAMYGGATSVALGGVPTDLFSRQGIERLANEGLSELSHMPSKIMNAVPKPQPLDPKAELERSLNARSIEELRQIEFEVKHGIAVSSPMYGIKIDAFEKESLLDQIEASKKYVKGH